MVQQGSKSSGGGGGFLVFVVIVIVLVVLARRSSSASNVNRNAWLLECSPAECIDDVTRYLVQRGFTIAYRGDTAATFTRPKNADTGLGCLLLLLGLIPGLLYFGLFKGTYTTTVTALRSDAETTQLVFSGDDGQTHRDLNGWVQENFNFEDED